MAGREPAMAGGDGSGSCWPCGAELEFDRPSSFPCGLNGYPGETPRMTSIGHGKDGRERSSKRRRGHLQTYPRCLSPPGRHCPQRSKRRRRYSRTNGVVARLSHQPHRFRANRLLSPSLRTPVGRVGIALVKINPRQARRFAEAIGRHAKTDAVDASMLARLGAMLQPPARPIPSQALHEMKELHVARCALLKDRVAATNRHHIRRLSLLRDQAQQRLRQIDRQIIAIDTALQAILDSNVALKARFDILTSIPGIGKVNRLRHTYRNARTRHH
jgi:hypothetical protein